MRKLGYRYFSGRRFERARKAYLAASKAFLCQDRAGEGEAIRKKNTVSKTKYTCLVCGDCSEATEAPLHSLRFKAVGD